MNGFPLLTRELRAWSRHWLTWYSRAGVMLVSALTAFGVIGYGLSSGWLASEIGERLFFILILLGGGCALFAGPVFTADCLSREKREETLGLLFLTPLRAGDIVAAKFTTALLPAFYTLLAYFPVLAMTLLLGGVTPGLLARGVVLVVVVLLLSLSVGVLVSACLRQALATMGVTLALLVSLVLAPLWMVKDPTVPEPGTLLLLLPSPTFAVLALFDPSLADDAHLFWTSMAIQCLMGIVGLFAASRVLPLIVTLGHLPWRFRWPWPRRNAVLTQFQKYETIARINQLSRLRRRLLEENPALWPQARRPLHTVILYWLMAFVLIATATVYLLVEDRESAFGTLAFSLLVATVVIKFWLAMAASRRANEDARSGVLELLLVTPMTKHQIIQGWLLGLKRSFFVPVILLVSSGLGLCFLNLDHLVFILFLTLLLLADLYTLAWVGLWMGVRSRTPAAATVRTLAIVVVLPWIAVLSGGLLSFLDLDEDLAVGLALGGYFLFSYFADLLWCVLVPRWLTRDMGRITEQASK